MEGLTRDYIRELLRTGSPRDLEGLLDGLPPTTFTEAARPLLGSSRPGMVVVALGPVAQALAYGADPAVGATLAAALHERGTELWHAAPDHNGIHPTTLSGLASSHVKALSLLGDTQAILETTPAYIRQYEELQEEENLPALYVLRLEALVDEERYDDAVRELEANGVRFEQIGRNPIWGMELRRLQKRIDERRIPAGQRRREGPPEGVAPPATELVDSLAQVLGSNAGEVVDRLRELAETGRSVDPNDAAEFRQLLDALKEGERFLTRGGVAETELTIRRRIRESSAIFVHGTPSRPRILESVGELQTSLSWAVEQGVRELENDANWGLYLCHSRLEQPSEAADALIRLRTSLERRRAGIRDPLERAGIFGDYRYLFNALCEKLYEAGRGWDLLEAIESSKGRVIADRLSQEAGSPVEDSAIYSSVERLPTLTRQYAFHYLTQFVDEDRVYAVLVDNGGELHVPAPVELDGATRKEASATVDPREWGTFRGRPGDTYPAANETLAPLVAWLEELFDRGVMSEGDHLVYSSDGELLSVPLQYLRLGAGILLDRVSVSRVQTAFEVVNVLERAPVRPRRFVGFVVPSSDDLARDDEGRMVAAFRAPVEWLEERMDGAVASMGEATLARLEDQDTAATLVHFSTHGVFPEGGNPFRDSFLLLADGAGLPDTATTVREEGRLTPRRVLGQGLRLADSHVSMMACVSGKASEGIGGDALGLDWAFLQGGAASLISTHWDVSAAAAASFFVLFYEGWLEDERTRAAAYREAVLGVLGGRRDADALVAAAGFSLTGDFR